LKLEQITQIQAASRLAQNLGRPVSTQDKKVLVAAIVETISRQEKAELKTEVFIAKALDLPSEKKSTKQHHGDGSITRADHYTSEENKIIQKACGFGAAAEREAGKI